MPISVFVIAATAILAGWLCARRRWVAAAAVASLATAIAAATWYAVQGVGW